MPLNSTKTDWKYETNIRQQTYKIAVNRLLDSYDWNLVSDNMWYVWSKLISEGVIKRDGNSPEVYTGIRESKLELLQYSNNAIHSSLSGSLPADPDTNIFHFKGISCSSFPFQEIALHYIILHHRYFIRHLHASTKLCTTVSICQCKQMSFQLPFESTTFLKVHVNLQQEGFFFSERVCLQVVITLVHLFILKGFKVYSQMDVDLKCISNEMLLSDVYFATRSI